MTAFNSVRFKIKAGQDGAFLDAHRNVHHEWPGLKHAHIIKTGEHTYCLIAEWNDADAMARARPNMIATLNSFRSTLEELGPNLGVTDAVSGPVVITIK